MASHKKYPFGKSTSYDNYNYCQFRSGETLGTATYRWRRNGGAIIVPYGNEIYNFDRDRTAPSIYLEILDEEERQIACFETTVRRGKPYLVFTGGTTSVHLAFWPDRELELVP